MTKGRKRTEGEREKPPNDTAVESTLGNEALRRRIAEKAYELYEKRDQSHGHDLDDWVEAERLVLREIRSQAHSKAKKPRSRGERSKKG